MKGDPRHVRAAKSCATVVTAIVTVLFIVVFIGNGHQYKSAQGQESLVYGVPFFFILVIGAFATTFGVVYNVLEILKKK